MHLTGAATCAATLGQYRKLPLPLQVLRRHFDDSLEKCLKGGVAFAMFVELIAGSRAVSGAEHSGSAKLCRGLGRVSHRRIYLEPKGDTQGVRREGSASSGVSLVVSPSGQLRFPLAIACAAWRSSANFLGQK